MFKEFTINGWTKLGGLVRDARLSQGFSQEKLAIRAGVARSWLARVESGHRGVELEPLLRLLAALDLSLTLRSADEPGAQQVGASRPHGDSVPDRAQEQPQHSPTAASGSGSVRQTRPAASPGPRDAVLKRAAAARRASWDRAARNVGK